jgi:drug/metabolite transporter (DMT)-like permease
MSASIFLGLLAALLYGAANFTVRPACHGAGIFRTMLYGQWLAVPVLTIALLFYGIPHASLAAWGMLLLSDLLLLIATGLVCHALATGRLAVAAPLAASYGGVSALLSAFTGEQLGIQRWIAVAVITAGSILVAGRERRDSPAGGTSGALPAAGAAMLFGLAYWLQAHLVIPAMGSLAPVWSYYLLGAILMPLVAWVRGISIARPSLPAATWIVATTALAVTAYLALSAGLATPFPVIATVLSTLSSAVTVVLGQLILKERGTVRGWAGLAAITAGLIVLRAL